MRCRLLFNYARDIPPRAVVTTDLAVSEQQLLKIGTAGAETFIEVTERPFGRVTKRIAVNTRISQSDDNAIAR